MPHGTLLTFSRAWNERWSEPEKTSAMNMRLCDAGETISGGTWAALPSRRGLPRKGAIWCYVVVASVGLAIGVGAGSASAQQPATTPPALTGQPTWSFNVAPYLWLPETKATVAYDLPSALGGTLSTTQSSGPGDYLPTLKFAAMLSADARYGRFSLLTDLMYVNAGVSQSNVRSLDVFGLPSRPIDRSLQTGTSSTLKQTIWTLLGGYTVLQGDWGNLDVLAGFRMADLVARTNYNLALTVTGPRGNGTTFGGAGSISGHGHQWNGVAGFRGGVNLPYPGFFIPYYFDIGAGGSDLTWQVASGVGYRTGRFSFSAQYRYLSFEQGDKAIRRLSMGGPLLGLNISF